MQRRRFVQVGGSIVGLGVLGTLQVAADEDVPEHPPGKTNERGNWIRGQSDLVEVDTVEAMDGGGFTYYKVTYDEQTFDTWVYREPDRLGGGNFVVPYEDATSDRFWYGISADGDEIVHDGQAIQYFETEDGWTELTAKFDDGELQDVNGVEPS